MYAKITREYTFDAAHLLPGYNGKCAHLHGHTYRLLVQVSGEVSDEVGNSDDAMVMDFADLDAIVKPLVSKLDHRFIAKGDEWPCNAARLAGVDDVFYMGQRTTAENIAGWFAHWVSKGLSTMAPSSEFDTNCIVFETPRSSASVRWEG